MKQVFRCRYILLGLIVISFGFVMSKWLEQHEHLSNQVSKRKYKVEFRPPLPPPSRGYPGNRKAAISRDSCSTPGANLVALAPEFMQKAQDSSKVNEISIWGKTEMERPILFFLVPYTDQSTRLEFLLQNKKDEIIYQRSITPPSREGVMALPIPSSVPPLEVNQDYRWTLKAKVFCGSNVPESKFVEGWLQRVSLTAASASQQSQAYVEQSIWYDMVSDLASQRQHSPNNLQLRQEWKGLLKMVQLEAVAEYPLLK